MHVACPATNLLQVTMMTKWRLALMGMGGVLGILMIAWLAWGSISYSTTTHALSPEAKLAEKSHDNRDQQVMDANSYYIERARAMEAGFKAAFPFHK